MNHAIPSCPALGLFHSHPQLGSKFLKDASPVTSTPFTGDSSSWFSSRVSIALSSRFLKALLTGHLQLHFQPHLQLPEDYTTRWEEDLLNSFLKLSAALLLAHLSTPFCYPETYVQSKSYEETLTHHPFLRLRWQQKPRMVMPIQQRQCQKSVPTIIPTITTSDD